METLLDDREEKELVSTSASLEFELPSPDSNISGNDTQDLELPSSDSDIGETDAQDFRLPSPDSEIGGDDAQDFVLPSPDSGIGGTDAQNRKLTSASVSQHNTKAQNCFANTLNPLFYKYQSVDNRKWALLKSLSQDSEYSLDDSFYDAEDILSELGFAGSRDPTIPERFLPSLMQRLSKFPESEMMSLNDRIIHSIGCFKRKEGKRRLFRNLSTGKDPLMGTSNQSSLSCPTTTSYPLLRSNTGPAAFTYDDFPSGTIATNTNPLAKKQYIDNEESLPRSPIAILVSQASVDLTSNSDGSGITNSIDSASESGILKTQASVHVAQSVNGRDSSGDDAKIPQDVVEDGHLVSFREKNAESTGGIDLQKSSNSSCDSTESSSREDGIYDSSSVSTPESSSKVATFEYDVKKGVSDVQKRLLRRASSPLSSETISKLSDNLRNSSVTELPSDEKVTFSSEVVKSSIITPKFSSLDNEDCNEYSYGDLNPEKSSECAIKYTKPEGERQTTNFGKFQFTRTSSLTNFLTSMLSADDERRCSNSFNLIHNNQQVRNDYQVSDNQTLKTQNSQQPLEDVSFGLKEAEIGNSDILTSSCEVEGLQTDNCKGRVQRRMSWSSQRTHSFEVVDSESESNVNLQYSKLLHNDFPLVEQPESVAEIPKADCLFCDGQETQSSFCKSFPYESAGDNSTEMPPFAINGNDDKRHSIHFCSEHQKNHKNALKRHRLISCPFRKELSSVADSPSQLMSSSGDMTTVVSYKKFHTDSADGKHTSRVNVARRIREFQNRYTKRSSFPSASSLSFSKRKSLDHNQTSTQKSPPPSLTSMSIVSTNDFFPSRASFEISGDHAGRRVPEQKMSPEVFVKECYDSVNFEEKKTKCRDSLRANNSFSDTSLPYCDDSFVSDVSETLQQSSDDICQMPIVNNDDQTSNCSSIFDEQISCIDVPHSENGAFSRTFDLLLGNNEPVYLTASPLLKNGRNLACLYKNSEERNDRKFSQNVDKHHENGHRVSRVAEEDYIKEVTSAGEHHSCPNKIVVGKLEECTNNNEETKSKSSVSSEHFLSSNEVSRAIFLDGEMTSPKASKTLLMQHGARNKSSYSREQACTDNKREALMERKIHAFSKLLANMGNPVLRRRTVDDASGTLSSTSDKSPSARKCFTPPPEVDRLVCLLKKEDTCPVYKSEVFMRLDDCGRASPTHYSACISMDINKDEKVDSKLKTHMESQLTSQEILHANHHTTKMPKASTTELPFKEVSKELEELQMSIQKAKETRISASRELHFLQELLSGDSADDHRDHKMKKNRRKYDKKSSTILPETGFQEDMTTAPGNTALSDLREKSKKDVLEDTEFWQEEIKKMKEDNDRVWQERLDRMEERLKSQEQELIQAQTENETLQRRLELQRLGSSPCHCKTDLQNGHGRADSAFEDDEEYNNHKPSTPTHSTRQDCERLQEQLIKTEQRADELNLLLNQKLIELNKLQITLSKQTKEMIELEKSYIQLQCRFRRGASKPVVSRLCSRSSPFSSKNLFPKPSPPASPGPTSICP